MNTLILTETNDKQVIGLLNKFFNKPQKKFFDGFEVKGSLYKRKNKRLPKPILKEGQTFLNLIVDFDYDKTLKITAEPDNQDTYDQFVNSIYYGDIIMINGNDLHIIQSRTTRKGIRYKTSLSFTPVTLKF